MSDFGSEEGEEDQGPYLGVLYFSSHFDHVLIISALFAV
jgi:hypothetical protein